VPATAGSAPASAAPAAPDAAGRAAEGLTVAEVLDCPSLAGAQVLAGRAGLGRMVERLNVMEVPDILPWVKPHELLLTTGYPLRATPESLADLVGGLDARGLSALGVKLGRYLDELPDAMLAEADRLGLPLVRLPDGVAFDDVLNDVLTSVLNRQSSALARSEQVHRSLLAVVLEGGGLTEVAERLATLLDAAVVLTTPDGRVLGEAGTAAQLAAARDTGCFDGSGRLRTEQLRPGIAADDAGQHAGVPIMAGPLDHGRIVAFGASGLGDGAVQVLERGATVAALVITKQLAVSAVESKYRGDFLRDLLDARAGDPVAAAEHARSLGWDVDRQLLVLVAQLDPPTGSAPAQWPTLRPAQDRFAAAWESVLHVRDRTAPVVGFSSEVVALCGVSADADVERQVADIVAAVSGDGGGGRRSFSTGVSRVVTGPESIPAAYEQARKAVAVSRQVHGGGAVAHFDRLGVFRLLSLVPDSSELRSFVVEVLGELATRDDPDALDLRRTLEVLLETNLNVAETARLLHFHYNTLRYRIAKLERLLGPFTDDPNLRLNVLLALQVLKMRGI
jgi:purine catabolism regulator